MLDKKDTTLIKLDCKSKDKVYDLLFGKADACLKNAKAVALLYLGSPYYMTRALEEYNIEEVNIFTTKDFKFIYEPFENAERAKIWYVDNVKDTFKECDMKFDCIIMNPPYQRNLHLKILAESIKHLKDDKSVCVNLSPDNWLMKHNLNNPIGKYRTVFSNDILDIEVIPHDKMNELFNTGNAIEEGCILTVSNGNGKLDLKHYGFNSKTEYSLYSKVSKCKDGILSIHKAVGVSGRACYGKSNKLYTVGIYGWHGGKDCRETVVCEDSKQPYITLFFNSENERKNFLNSLDTLFMNWYCKAFIEPGNYIVKNHFFIMQDYSKPWDDARFYKFFNITSEEQKVIEETMEKYK